MVEGASPYLLIASENIVEEKKLALKVSYQATHDSMTGLINRREFDELLSRVAQAAASHDEGHALLYLDLDQFKIVNDTLGHRAGDKLLFEIAQILKDGVREGDVVARLGGDEFAVLLAHCEIGEAKQIALNLLSAIDTFRFQWESDTLRVHASIGLVKVGEGAGTASEIMAAADMACYKAKQSGRDRVEIYEMTDASYLHIRDQMNWVWRINNGLEKDLFHLYAQIIEPTSGAAERLHFEVLIRLSERSGEVINASEFVPAAEQYGLGSELDRWVLRKVLATMIANPRVLDQIETCAINLSAHSLVNEGFADFAVAEIQRSGIAPEKICFEITETAVITDVTLAIRFISSLRALGCRFSLDDFGSGQSSFQYLRTLEVEFIKIDGFFVRNLLGQDDQIAIVRSICQLAHALGKKCIAESVESTNVRDQLLALGADYVQGTAVSLQMPLAKLFSDWQSAAISPTAI